MIDFLHQCQQTAEFTVGETLASEPVEVLTWQVGKDSTLVLAKGHLTRDEQLELFRIHGNRLDFKSVSKIQAFCMQAK